MESVEPEIPGVELACQLWCEGEDMRTRAEKAFLLRWSAVPCCWVRADLPSRGPESAVSAPSETREAEQPRPVLEGPSVDFGVSLTPEDVLQDFEVTPIRSYSRAGADDDGADQHTGQTCRVWDRLSVEIMR